MCTLGNRSVTPTLPLGGFVRQDAPHATSDPRADGEVAGAAHAVRLELEGDLAALGAAGVEAALVAEALRADAGG